MSGVGRGNAADPSCRKEGEREAAEKLEGERE